MAEELDQRRLLDLIVFSHGGRMSRIDAEAEVSRVVAMSCDEQAAYLAAATAKARAVMYGPIPDLKREG
jgi:hypothetical protein